VGHVVLFSLTAALNPTLLGATTVMLLLPSPKRMLLGYLLGAALTSITLGLVIIFALEDSSSVSTAQNTISPATNFTLGGLVLLIAYVLYSDRDRHLRERRAERKERKGKASSADSEPPRWQRALSQGSARTTFVVGALLTLPGGSYLAGLHAIHEQGLGTAGTVALVLGFNVVMLALLEVPLLGYALAPESTPGRVQAFREWLGRNGRRMGIRVATVVGVLLIVRGAVELLS